jgi:hypothetical protein
MAIKRIDDVLNGGGVKRAEIPPVTFVYEDAPGPRMFLSQYYDKDGIACEEIIGPGHPDYEDWLKAFPE